MHNVGCGGYLGPQPSLLDLGDVGVGGVQCVQVHFAQLVVVQFPELPGQVIMSEGTQVTQSNRDQR